MTTHTQTTNYTHYFYHSDALGNITAFQDTNQVVQAKYMYDPWGGMFAMSGALTNLNRMRMAGKEWHPQTGLMDFGARFYNPTWQRWMNEDPIGINGGLNLYRYVGNSPLNYIDPWGLVYDEDADLDARLEMASEVSAMLGTYVYDPDTLADFYEDLEEGWEDVTDWAKRMLGEAAEDLAWKAACPLLIKPAREQLKKAAKKAAKGFSNANFGNAIHQRFRDALTQQTGTQRGDWLMRTRPGQKGVDATYIGPASRDPGFKHAELKPNSPGSISTFGDQLSNWDLPPGKTELWLYNEGGIIGSSGFRF